METNLQKTPLSRIRNSLLTNSNWEERRKSVGNENATPQPKASLKDRLAALQKSADNWQNRVKKDSTIESSNGRRKSLAKSLPPRPPGKENAGCAKLPESKVGLLISLDKGLEAFFPRTMGTCVSSTASADPIELDIDSVQRTEVLRTPRRPVLKKGERKMRDKKPLITQIDTSIVKVEEDPRDYLTPILIEDDGEPVAKSAKAGLAAVESYTDTKHLLKAVSSVSPYPPVMLIRIKGEKKMDVRLVAPRAHSVFQSACFVLVTPDRLFKYEGDQSNVLERTKATQICIDIVRRNDLHCSVKKEETVSGAYPGFFKVLGGGVPLEEEPGFPIEPFEITAARSNLVLRVTDDYKLETVCKGERVYYNMLQSQHTLILDFGSEIYVWSGRHARKTTGRYAVEYAMQLKSKRVANSLLMLGESLDDGRADWVHYRRLVQGVNDVLFSSKFPDWQSSENKFMYTPTPKKTYNNVETPSNTEKEDSRLLGNSLRQTAVVQPVTVLEDYEIDRCMKDVIFESLELWQLGLEQLESIPFTNILYDDRCYVIKWKYRVQLSGVRKLRTGEECERETGRERFAFFYWLGRRTTPKQQGLCALRLSHMDRDKHTHIRLAQGAESPLFLKLFDGKLIVISGKEHSGLYLVLGATSSEGHAVEIEDGASLRSHAVYLRCSEDTIQILAGLNCVRAAVKTALVLTDEIKKNWKKFGLMTDDVTVKDILEGENEDKWTEAKGRTRCPLFYRLYEREGDIISCPQQHDDNPFPFEQTCLCDTMFIDVGGRLWIWAEKAPTTFALRVAERLWADRDGAADIVLKGNEPEDFQALFPRWEDWIVEEALTPTTPPRKLTDLMAERTRKYPLSDLQSRENLPDGIDMSCLEQYLNDTEFETAFGMDRTEFVTTPQWKQIRMRKKAGLF